ncbi:phosphatase PAP2-related protein [Pedobacter cryoconitis]|uniref:Sphingomyelin synthase-like domain-containing protein n=1 Tax=Pedobacter cryoconitis TaxID=188932 RepID=A0A7X0J824_9SPHI|nr:phosphatase PAP2-related protein [Pedobacter cryoconitis]MBB6502530.1 hypothetical protein [Pedobacter cryoconitis]
MQSKQLTWQFAWEYPAFRVKFILGIIVMSLVLFFLQDFFLFIQARNGVLMNDWVLSRLPAYDVSHLIFLILYPATGFFIWRIIRNSSMCITALWGYIFLCLARMITISMIPLDAPLHLVHLSDPFSIFFYGSNVITKDLFFSGHTATLCLVGLCLENKREKMIVFIATGLLGVLLLIQHVHYTADVLAAPVFSYIFWYLGKTITRI